MVSCNEFTLEKFLEDREIRVEHQYTLLKKYEGILIAVRANYPGEHKIEYPAPEIVEIISKEIEQLFPEEILYCEETLSLEGKIKFFIIKNSLDFVKQICVFIEEKHDLGRFVDIDVYDKEGTSISRIEYGYPQRKCYLCDETGVVCTRARTHAISDLKKHILKSYERYLLNENLRVKVSEKLGELALKACILELSCHPSFGLVSPLTSGAHSDMDYFTFLNSSFAIKKGITKMGYIGFSYLSLEEAFKIARVIGIETEREMFEATKGINTHKGMIFLLGVVIVSVGKLLYEKNLKTFKEKKELAVEERDLYSISQNIKECCKDILLDFELIEEKVKQGYSLTNGEKLYLNYGFLGIRGEVKEGIQIVFKRALPYLEDSLKKGNEINDAMVGTLLTLMTTVEDSTIVNRLGVDTLKKIKEEASELLKSGIPKEEAYRLEKEYSKLGISPGGSADLLAVTIFLYFLRKDKILFTENFLNI